MRPERRFCHANALRLSSLPRQRHIPESDEGQQVNCPACGATVATPSPVPAPGLAQAQQTAIPDMKTCPHCGGEVRVEAILCKHCKTSLIVEPLQTPPSSVPATKRCPFCAEEIRAEAVLCKHCKSPFPAAILPAATSVPPATSVTTTPVMAQSGHSLRTVTQPEALNTGAATGCGRH